MMQEWEDKEDGTPHTISDAVILVVCMVVVLYQLYTWCRPFIDMVAR